MTNLSPRSLERWLRGLGSLVPREAVASLIEEVHRCKMNGDAFSELVRSRETPALDGVRASHMATLRRCWRAEYANVVQPSQRRAKSPQRGLAPPPPPPMAPAEAKELTPVKEPPAVFAPPPRGYQDRVPGREVNNSNQHIAPARDVPEAWGEENITPEEYYVPELKPDGPQKKKGPHVPRLNLEAINPYYQGKRDTSPLRHHTWTEPPRLPPKGGPPIGFSGASRADQQRILDYYGYGGGEFLDTMHGLRTDQIRPRLFVGTMADAAYWPLLQQLRITHVVNVAVEAQSCEPPYESHGVSYLLLPLVDSPEQAQLLNKNRFEVLKRATKFIRSALRSNARHGSCLVHCVQGLSRSAAVVAAYLMEYEGMSVDRAVAEVRAKHPGCLNPNHWQELLRNFHYHLLRGL